MKPIIYCAGPITGQSGKDVFEYYDNITEKLKGFKVIHPMTGKDFLRTESDFSAYGYFQPIAQDKSIFNRDKWMVKQSDIVFANLTRGRDKVSIGTVMEIAFAHLMGKLVIAVIPIDNIHNHSFIDQACATVFTDEKEAFDYLAHLGELGEPF